MDFPGVWQTNVTSAEYGEKAPNPLKGTGIDDKQISVVTELRRQHGKTTKVEKDRDW